MGKDPIKRILTVPDLSAARADARACATRLAAQWFLGMKMASANDMKAANSTYSGFVNLVKWSTPAICVLVFVIILIIQ